MSFSSAAVLVGISVTPTAAEFPQLPAAAASQQGTALIHVLIVADTKDPTIGKGTETDLAALTQFFEENVSGDSLDLHALTGDSVTQEQILKSHRQFLLSPVRRDGFLLVWSWRFTMRTGTSSLLVRDDFTVRLLCSTLRIEGQD